MEIIIIIIAVVVFLAYMLHMTNQKDNNVISKEIDQIVAKAEEKVEAAKTEIKEEVAKVEAKAEAVVTEVKETVKRGRKKKAN